MVFFFLCQRSYLTRCGGSVQGSFSEPSFLKGHHCGFRQILQCTELLIYCFKMARMSKNSCIAASVLLFVAVTAFAGGHAGTVVCPPDNDRALWIVPSVDAECSSTGSPTIGVRSGVSGKGCDEYRRAGDHAGRSACMKTIAACQKQVREEQKKANEHNRALRKCEAVFQ